MGRAEGLPKFIRVEEGGKVALVHPEFRDAVAGALLEGIGCEPTNLTGRAPLLRFSYREGSGLIRRYRRGGLVRHFIKESFLLDNRPQRELGVHREAYAKGLPVPMPLGVCWGRIGPLYRGAIAVAELDDAQHLLDYLASGAAQLEETLRNCGAMIRQMHDAGILHADLQIRNILIAAGKPHIIDFDKGRVCENVSPSARRINLVRLRRSFEKNTVSLKHFDAIMTGYEGKGIAPRSHEGHEEEP